MDRTADVDQRSLELRTSRSASDDSLERRLAAAGGSTEVRRSGQEDMVVPEK